MQNSLCRRRTPLHISKHSVLASARVSTRTFHDAHLSQHGVAEQAISVVTDETALAYRDSAVAAIIARAQRLDKVHGEPVPELIDAPYLSP